MDAVLDLLAKTPLLTIALVIAMGTVLGAVPFGPVRFGPAGALFVGLAVGALDKRLGTGLTLVQTIGLALFVYTVGLASGASFFRGLRRQLPLMLGAVGVLGVAAAIVMGFGAVLGIASPLRAGGFAGALTSTPTLAAATARAGSDKPAIGYALAYPVGVTIAILAVSWLVSRRWPAAKDVRSMAARGLVDVSVEVLRRARLGEVPGFADHLLRFSYLSRGGQTRVTHEDEVLEVGDRVVLIGPEQTVAAATAFLGRRVSTHLAHDRSTVDYRRILLSQPALAGRTVGDLDVPGRFDGVVTRVRRGDLDLLASEDLVVELGDRLRVVVPRGRMREVSAYLGDSERRVSEVDALSLGVGLSLGLLVGLVTVPLPGGIRLALGAAAGPLVVGMVLGRVERTAGLVWGLPTAANLTLRQLGLLLFLSCVGLASGPAFAAQAFSLLGLKLVVLAAATVGVAAALMSVLAKSLGTSPARAAGALAGFIGQPAILAYANGRVADERIDAGYASLFALGIIVKILLVQVIVG
ncbi:MAG TPA: TrkA C-terminal domain-containing protein [Dermatophilaceae bacterium]|nr:TrkA C-terminal domain-containing protein [Dermatophilaceae bacterium]